MIRRIRHKGLRKFYEKGSKEGIQPEHEGKLRLILNQLDSANRLSDIDAPGLDLHELKGGRKGTHAVSVSGNWRVTFRFENGDILDVDYEDYH